jgi:hypothetical protein
LPSRLHESCNPSQCTVLFFFSARLSPFQRINFTLSSERLPLFSQKQNTSGAVLSWGALFKGQFSPIVCICRHLFTSPVPLLFSKTLGKMKISILTRPKKQKARD